MIMLHPDPGLSAAVAGLRVVVRCRPNMSQSNNGREGVILRACANPETYEVKFDVPDHRGHNWDYVHERDLMVTEMNGQKIKGDGLDIPTFLKRVGRTAPKVEQEAADRVMDAAKRGAGIGVPSMSTPESRARAKHPKTPGGDLAMKAELEFGKALPREIDQAAYDMLKTQHAAKSVVRSAEGKVRRAEKASVRVSMLTFRQAVLELRTMDAAWAKLTRAKLGPMLEKAKWPMRDGAWQFTKDELQEVARVLRGAVGPGGPAPAGKGKGKAPPAPTSAQADAPAPAKPRLARRKGALR